MPAFSYVIKLWILILLQHNLSWPILNSKKWVKAVDTCPFVLGSVNDWYKTQEMCDKIVSGDFFMLKYFLDRYKTQGMCNKAADTFLPTLKFILDWYVTSMIKKLDDL